MRLLTWNINSVRLRLPLLEHVVKSAKPDIVCLQETKTHDDTYPKDALTGLGFAHQAFTGIKGYNGVAILSKYPLQDIEIHPRCGKNDARHISAHVSAPGFAGGVELHNIYIPAGGYEPDPVTNEKFQHKLDFVDELSSWFPKKRSKKKPMIVVGDLNIAPLENDVWDHRQMKDVVSHTPVEIEKFARFYKSMDWHDALRHFVPEEEKLYTWWSYRAEDWEKSDRGRRLDHVWVTQGIKSALKKCEILKDVRRGVRPSDHAPVVVDFKKAA